MVVERERNEQYSRETTRRRFVNRKDIRITRRAPINCTRKEIIAINKEYIYHDVASHFEIAGNYQFT